MVHVGNNIARLRSFRRIPQKDMANRLGIKQQDYSRLESKEIIDDEVLLKIAKELNFPVEAIKEMEASTTIQTVYQQTGNNGNGFNVITSEKVEEMYERLLAEKDEVIKMQKEMIEMYKQHLKAS